MKIGSFQPQAVRIVFFAAFVGRKLVVNLIKASFVVDVELGGHGCENGCLVKCGQESLGREKVSNPESTKGKIRLCCWRRSFLTAR